MKIGYSRINAYNKATTVSSQKGRSEKAEKTGVIKTDKVTISAEGTEYKGLTKIQNEMTAGVNEYGGSTKLERIKRQISEGKYNIPAEELAGRILERLA